MNPKDHEANSSSKAETPQPGPVPPVTKNTVLVMDDVVAVANLLHKIATRENFRVLKAFTTQEALALLEDPAHLADLRVAFLDLMVGVESGLTVYRHLRALAPRVPIVLMSGYVFNVVIPPLLARDRYAMFMLKPFEVSVARGLMQNPLAHGGNLLQRPLDATFG